MKLPSDATALIPKQIRTLFDSDLEFHSDFSITSKSHEPKNVYNWVKTASRIAMTGLILFAPNGVMAPWLLSSLLSTPTFVGSLALASYSIGLKYTLVAVVTNSPFILIASVSMIAFGILVQELHNEVEWGVLEWWGIEDLAQRVSGYTPPIEGFDLERALY